jgi:hypothetical protein
LVDSSITLFDLPLSTPGNIEAAVEKASVAIYNGKINESLDTLKPQEILWKSG